MKKFETAIINGLKQTIVDYIFFKGPGLNNEWTKPEYLATVNIAKSISKFNTYPAEHFIISIEENTRSFSSMCVKEEYLEIFDLQQEQYNPERNGKIDIAVYDSITKESLCTIEIKNFNPTVECKGKLILDLQRNSEYFNFKNKSNKSLIKRAYIAYFRHFEETRFAIDLDNDLLRAKQELEDIIKESINTTNIVTRVEVDTVHDNLLFSGKYTEEEIFNEDVYGNAGHFVGVIGVFEMAPGI